MRNIERTARFRRDYKRMSKALGGNAMLDAELVPILAKLANDLPLDERQCDHAMIGNWKDHRNCHVRPDLVLLYRKPDNESLQLVRLGSHAELGI